MALKLAALPGVRPITDNGMAMDSGPKVYTSEQLNYWHAHT